MNKINRNQQIAIETIDGPVLIIAGPGSGKTYTIVERVIHMVADRDIEPSQIMVSTFTNKAATELLDRLSLKFKELNIAKDINDMFLGNFHEICRRIIDEYIDYLDLKRGYQMIDDVAKRYIISKYIDHFRKIKNYATYYQKYEIKNIEKTLQAIFEDGIIDRKSNNVEHQVMFDIASLYESIMKKHNILDFSMILYHTYKLLKTHPKVRDELRDKIKYIMIDEYQDTNRVQEKILFELLNDEENICVVGDDDQGLYRFRGATVKNILEFGKQFKQPVTRVNLETNYRSTQDIIDFYIQFMDSIRSYVKDIDKYRYDKKIYSNDPNNSKSVFKLGALNEDEYREKIVSLILELKSKGVINEYNEVGVLVTSVNDQRVAKLGTALKKANIGLYTPKTSTLLSRTEIHLIIGAIYAIFLPYIQKNKVIIDYKTQEFLGICLGEFLKKSKKDENMEIFIESMSKYLLKDSFSITMLDIVYRLFRYEPFKSILDDEINEKSKKNISRFLELIESYESIHQNFNINQNEISKYVSGFFGDFVAFIKQEKVAEFDEDTIIPQKDQVSLLTIHSSKGMEYPVVIMASLWDKPFNSYKFTLDNMINSLLSEYGREEFEPIKYNEILDYYRKYFTGFSRAKNLLILARIESDALVSYAIKPFYEKLSEIKESDFSGIRREPYKEETIKKVYSYTQDIVNYRKCPRAYYFFRLFKFRKLTSTGIYYGSIVHETIEYINKRYIDNEPLDRDDIHEQATLIARSKYLKGAIGLTKDSIDMIKREVDKYLDFMEYFDAILDSELQISMATKDYILTGNVDLIYEKNGKLGIMDFKTGRSPVEIGNDELLNQYMGQLRLYAYLYKETKKQDIDDIVLYFTGLNNQDSIHGEHLRKNDIDIDHIDKTIRQIETDKEFKKTDDIEKCKYCEMRFYCDRV